MKFEIDTQLTTPLDSNPTLEIHRLVALLKERQVSVLAVAESEANGRRLARLTSREGEAAQQVLAEHGYHVTADPVIAIRLDECKGCLATITQTLARSGVSIDYIYPSYEPDTQASRLILKVSNIPLASHIVEATAPAA